MKNKILLDLYSSLLEIRIIETTISKRYFDQKMRCPIHLSIGQESVPVAVSKNLTKKDQVVTAHRSHAHYLAKGGSVKSMISELHGKINGCAKGLGGSMHLIDVKAGVTAAVPIVGSTLPIGVGKAWANKLKKNNNIVVIYFGDGATEEGVFLESLDFASLHNLRVLFVCENNNFSVYSPIHKRQNPKRKITSISEAVGIKSNKFEDHNILNLYKYFKKNIKYIREKSKPALVEINTFRYLEHCGPNNDDYLGYRKNTYIKKWKLNDQISYMENYLKRKKILKDSQIDKFYFKFQKKIDETFEFAIKSKYPNKKLLTKFIYAK